MIVTIVHVSVKPDFVSKFIDATRANHEGSIQEPGNLRFDVLQNPENPSRFVIYEAYESEVAAAKHKKTRHYLEWREKVEDWMAKPREGYKHKVVYPTDLSKW